MRPKELPISYVYKVHCWDVVASVLLLKEMLCFFKTSGFRCAPQCLGAPERCLKGFFGVRGAWVGLQVGPCYTHSKHLLFSEIHCRKRGSVGDTYCFTTFLLVRAPWFSSRDRQPLPMCVDYSAWSRNRGGQDSDLTNWILQSISSQRPSQKGNLTQVSIGLAQVLIQTHPFPAVWYG